MRFGYYDNLSPAEKRTYRKSDALEQIPLKNAGAIAPAAVALNRALETGARTEVAKQASVICRMICRDLGIPSPVVKIKAARPSSGSDDELHGLYEYTEGEAPVITVWMKTAAKQQVVAFKSFIRTVLHELCHHIDYAYFGLDDTFHTQGFFKRESRLYKDIVPEALRKKGTAKTPHPRKAAAKRPTSPRKKPAGKRSKPEQLEMF